MTCGAGAEIAAIVCEEAFEKLKAPVIRLAARDIASPFSPVLENAIMPNEEDIKNAIRKILG